MLESEKLDWRWVLLIGILFSLVGACKSDTAKSAEPATDVSSDMSGTTTSTVSGITPEERKTMESGLAQARKFEADFIQLNRKFEAMRDEVKKLPVAYKKNAKDYALLEATLDQFGQSSEYIKTELTKLIQPLEAKTNPEKFAEAQKETLQSSDQSTLAPDWEKQMGVLDRTIIDFGQSLGKMEAVVEKLKGSKGGPVVLFE